MRCRSAFAAFYLLNKKVLFIYFLTFCVMLPYICQDWPYSIYFRNSKYKKVGLKIAEQLNNERVRSTKAYFRSRNVESSRKFYEDKLKCDIIDYLVIVVTVKREIDSASIPGDDAIPSGQYGYLIQTLSALDAQLRQNKTRCESALMICNSHHKANEHEEATYMSKYFTSASVPAYTKENLPLENRLKEQHDKIKCIESIMQINFRYLLMIEDDAIPNPNFLPILQSVVRNQVECKLQLGQRHCNNTNWAYFNLHFPDLWQGFSLNVKTVLELLAFGFIGGSFSIIFLYFVCKTKDLCFKDFIYSMLFIILLIWLIGRQYLLGVWPLSYHVLSNSGCCTPATVYSKRQLPTIVNYLKNVKCNKSYGIDLALSDYGDDYDLQKYVIFPNLFRHIGLYSIVNSENKNYKYFLFS